MERRFIKDRIRLVKRADGKQSIVGYGSVFYDGTPDTEFELWDDLVERIMPGAFDRAIEEKDDARALFNHDPSRLLGRVSAGTLDLSVDKRGLFYSIAPGETTIHADVRQMIERGDLTGSSFGFFVTDQKWEKEDGKDIRMILGVELFDVGPVTYPAYEGTTTGIRSAGDLDEARAAWEKHRKEEAARRGRAYAARARAISI